MDAQDKFGVALCVIATMIAGLIIGGACLWKYIVALHGELDRSYDATDTERANAMHFQALAEQFRKEISTRDRIAGIEAKDGQW